jgi:N utilization substance protein B
VLGEFHAHRLADLLEPLEVEDAPPVVDREWFHAITAGAWRRAAELDPLIEATLAPGWSLERLGYLLRGLLRAGAFELADRPDVPARVVVDEYTSLAHGFLEPHDAGFVNAALDHLAKQLRPPPEATPEPTDG